MQAYLGDGEQEAIQLMHEQQTPLSVTDDRQAYNAALARSIPVTRTLRVLERIDVLKPIFARVERCPSNLLACDGRNIAGLLYIKPRVQGAEEPVR